MTPSEFIHSIYLGDRACKAILVDGWAGEVKVKVDCISRVRGETWNFYNKENLIDGFIVFEGVDKIEWDPNGMIPNDAINDFTVEPCTDGQARHVFTWRSRPATRRRSNSCRCTSAYSRTASLWSRKAAVRESETSRFN